MGFESFNSGVPADDNEQPSIPNANDLSESLNIVDLPEEERNKLSKERHEQDEQQFRELEQRALASMAGGPKLNFREKQDIITRWNARLGEEERKDLIERLNAVK